MLKNCKGCEEEFEEAIRGQESGLYLATSLEREFDGRKHFFLIMVDDKGDIIWS